MSKPSKKKVTVIHNDYIDVSMPDEYERQICITVEVLKRSLDKDGRKGKFRRRDLNHMIDLSNDHQFHVDENWMYRMEFK